MNGCNTSIGFTWQLRCVAILSSVVKMASFGLLCNVTGKIYTASKLWFKLTPLRY